MFNYTVEVREPADWSDEQCQGALPSKGLFRVRAFPIHKPCGGKGSPTDEGTFAAFCCYILYLIQTTSLKLLFSV